MGGGPELRNCLQRASGLPAAVSDFAEHLTITSYFVLLALHKVDICWGRAVGAIHTALPNLRPSRDARRQGSRLACSKPGQAEGASCFVLKDPPGSEFFNKNEDVFPPFLPAFVRPHPKILSSWLTGSCLASFLWLPPSQSIRQFWTLSLLPVA